MTTDKLSIEVIQSIWDAQGLGIIHQIEQPSQGNINQCWIVNDLHVIRFDVLDWGGKTRYAGEKWAYDMLRISDIPVPQVLVLDSSKKLAPYDYLILTKSPGKTVNHSLLKLSDKAQHHIAYTAGVFLATIHSHTLDGFGLLYDILADAPQPDWSTYVSNFYQDYARQAEELNMIPDTVLTRIQQIQEKMLPLFTSIKQGYFVHGDYHFSNLLQVDGEISAVLDFDWAMSGDKSWDFRIDNELESASAGSKEAFYAGYLSRHALPDHHWERVAFYRIGLYLDYLTTFSVDNELEATRNRSLLMNELTWLESRL